MDTKPSRIDRQLERINADLINRIIFLVGLCTLILSFFARLKPEVQNILISIGCSLIASAVVSFLTSKYLIRVNRIKEIVERWGLQAIYETRQKMNRSTDTAFESLENNLDIIAWGLKSFRDAKDKIVREKIQKGLKIRIIVPLPDSEFVRQREKDEKEIEGQIRQTIINLKSWVDDLKKTAHDPSDVQIKYYNRLPEDFYFRVDDHIFIGPYLYGISSQQTISYEFSGHSVGFDYYRDYFERLWNDTDFCA